jgi:hypothetical protein
VTVRRLVPLCEPEEWARALEGVPHVFGHTWGSCNALSLDGRGKAQLFLAEDGGEKVVCPLIEREIDGRLDIATPY